MSLAMIGRCDPGGLGTITSEVHRHLTPDRTLLLDLGARGRGPCHDYPDGNGTIMRAQFAGALPDRAVEWLCGPGIDVLWSAETFYDDEKILRAARANGIRTVVHAMPELAPWADGAPGRDHSAPRPAEILIPTGWRAHTLPGARWLPIPVAMDRSERVFVGKAAHLFHPTGAAMLDRNGTDLLMAALPHVQHPCRLTVRTERNLRIPRSRVDVRIIDEPCANYWDACPPDVDLLVLPRRYGGLSLPAQECAARAIPAVMLESDPYAPQPWVLAVPTTRSRPRSMKGGTVDVYDASPVALAGAIDLMVEDWSRFRAMAWAAQGWAYEHRWDGPLGEQWCEVLSADCERRAVA